MASFFLTQKVQTLEATQAGTSEPLHPSIFSATLSLFLISYAPTTLFTTDFFLETSYMQFAALPTLLHPSPSCPNTL